MKFFPIILFLLLASLCNAQVSGNVKLVDVHQQLLNDHSGIRILFTATGLPGVTDSAFTDAQGNYSKTLVQGTYTVSYSKDGFVKKTFVNFLIPSVPYVRPNDRLYEDYPVVNYAGRLPRVLQPFTHYVSTSRPTFLEYDTIPVGDTVLVSGGAWLDVTDLQVSGVLIIQGTAANPAIVLTPRIDSLGYTPLESKLNIGPGGQLFIDHAVLDLTTTATGANINVQNSNSKAWWNYGFIDTTFLVDPLGHQLVPTFTSTIDNSIISVSDCDIALSLGASNFSTVTVSCSNFHLYSSFTTATTVSFSNNYMQGDIRCFDCGAIDIHDNYFYYCDLFASNGQPGAADLRLINNSFITDRFSPRANISGNIRAYIVNNAGLNFITGQQLPPATFVDFKYNVLFPPYMPDSVIAPAGLPLTLPVLTVSDTIDLYHNHYLGQQIDSLYTNFPNLLVSTNNIVSNMGDPSLLDPDGSRSDIGARRDTIACTNPAIPYPIVDSAGSVITGVNDSVWPGDANYDGLVDNTDLLPIGLRYGVVGPIRANASLMWEAQYANPWNDSLANHRDIKHVDCNGDGLIDSTDMDAIYQNYSLTHITHKQQGIGDDLWLQFPAGNLLEGDTVEVGVMLGHSNAPISNLYGLAYSIHYDPNFIKAGSAKMKFSPCWLGTDSVDMISFFKDIQSVTRYDVALTRTDRQAMSGNGQIGTLIVVINDDILAKNYVALPSQLTFSDIFAIDQNEQQQPITGGVDSFIVNAEYTGIATAKTPSIQVYPNPAKERIIIAASEMLQGNISLITLDGRTLSQTALTGQQTTLDVSTLPSGLYVVKISTSSSVVYRKIQVNH